MKRVFASSSCSTQQCHTRVTFKLDNFSSLSYSCTYCLTGWPAMAVRSGAAPTSGEEWKWHRPIQTMRPRPAPIVAAAVTLMRTNVGRVGGKAACSSPSRLESVPIVGEKAKSRPTAVTSVRARVGLGRKDRARNRDQKSTMKTQNPTQEG